ncbi:MAG: AAA family ATPase, partial [Oscillospiraceae bacterium]|nr:AAA family ATPase [Oscillospiraceae bacterium]
DELGLLVWIDFMFACASYELDDAIEANIRAEVVDNVRRIRHHACLALWCGNNEMETQTLDEAWEPSIKQKYDYIIIDCPPELGLLTLNGLCASDTVLIPLQCEFYSLEGLAQLVETIRLVKQKYNPTIDVEGILFTMYDGRLNLTNQVVNEVKKHFPKKVYKTVIPRNVRLSEAPSFGKPVMYFDKSSKGAMSYEELGIEFLKNQKKK